MTAREPSLLTKISRCLSRAARPRSECRKTAAVRPPVGLSVVNSVDGRRGLGAWHLPLLDLEGVKQHMTTLIRPHGNGLARRR